MLGKCDIKINSTTTPKYSLVTNSVISANKNVLFYSIGLKAFDRNTPRMEFRHI